MDKELFRKDPRDFALGLVEDGMVDPMLMLQACLNWMSTDEVREMLDANELSPRFDEDEQDEFDEFDDDRQPDEAQEWADFDPDC
jgi:hypothetical protein